MSRRTRIASLAAAALTAGVVLPLTLAHAAPCMTFTDPTGDSFARTDDFPKPVPATSLPVPDDALDITGVAFDTIGPNLVVSVYVKKLSARPAYAPGDAFEVQFTHATKKVDLYAYRYEQSAIGGAFTTAGFPQQGMQVTDANVTNTVKVAYKTAENAVVFTVPLAEIDAGVKTPTAGASFTKLFAKSGGDYLFEVIPWDTAPAPPTQPYAVGSLCGGGAGGPAPAPSGSGSAAPSASATPSASAAPSATPSAAPSGTASPAPSGSAAPAPAGLPKDGCTTFTDGKGDAKPLNSNNPNNDPDLDFTGLTLQTTGDALVAYMKVDKLAAGPSTTDGHRFAFLFTHNKTTFTASGSSYKTPAFGTLRETLSGTGQVGKTVQLAVNALPLGDANRGTNTGFVTSGLKYTFDTKTSYIVASLPIADIEKHAKAPLAGATLTAISATSALDYSSLSSAPVDTVTATKADEAVYAVGNNPCFGAPPAVLTNLGAVKAQYGDKAAVAVKLASSTGAALVGKRVTVTLGSTPVSLTTGSGGVAKIGMPVRSKAGDTALKANWAGDDSAASAVLSVPFTVLVEKTALRASGGKGNVTATLIDDEKAPVAGQTVTFTSGKIKKTARTDAKGVAKAPGFPPGSSVTVSYPGASGMYAPSKTSAKA